MLTMLLASAALAYETDQLAARDAPLADAAPEANAWMDEVVAGAVAETNESLRCLADVDDTRDVLARHLAQDSGRITPLHGRGWTRSFGYGRYEILLEQGPVDRVAYDTPGIYADVRFLDSPIIKVAGVASTIDLAGVRIGTDKIDHFLVDGYLARNAERRGGPSGAERFSTRTERTTLGWLSSDVFSYGDIAADISGQQFYDALLTPGSVVQLGADGCATVAHPWSWADHVDGSWDELLNPSVYRPGVNRAVSRWLDENQAAVCDSYDRFGGPAYEAERASVIAERPTYVAPNAITGPDPLDLGERCRDDRAVTLR